MSNNDKVFHILKNRERTGILNEITLEIKKYEKQFPLFDTENRIDRKTLIMAGARIIREIAMIDKRNKIRSN